MTRSNPPPAAESSPDDQHPLRGTALTLGVIGAAFALMGTGLAIFGDTGTASPVVGVSIRVGAILLAVSAVIPAIKKPSTRTVLLIGAGLALVLVRPGLIWAGLAAWLVWAIMRRQRERTAKRES